MILRLLILLLLAGIIILAIFYHRPVALAWNGWVLEQDVRSQLIEQNWIGVYHLCEPGIRLYPDNAMIIRGLAAYYHYHAHDPTRARYWYLKLLRQLPDDVGVRLAFVNLLQQELKQPDQALRILWEGARLKPEGTLFIQQIAKIYQAAANVTNDDPERQRLFRLALKYYSLVLQRNPQHYGALFASGLIEQQLNRWSMAAMLFCHCTEISPKSYPAMYNLGQSLIGSGQIDLGLKTLSHAVQFESEMGNINTARWLAERAQSIRNTLDGNDKPMLTIQVLLDPEIEKIGCLKTLGLLTDMKNN